MFISFREICSKAPFAFPGGFASPCFPSYIRRSALEPFNSTTLFKIVDRPLSVDGESCDVNVFCSVLQYSVQLPTGRLYIAVFGLQRCRWLSCWRRRITRHVRYVVRLYYLSPVWSLSAFLSVRSLQIKL